METACEIDLFGGETVRLALAEIVRLTAFTVRVSSRLDEPGPHHARKADWLCDSTPLHSHH